jgi:hypothetical protein
MAKTDLKKLHWRYRLSAMRFLRNDDTTMRKHRSMFQLRLHRGELLIAFMLPMIFNLLLLLLIDPLIWFWRTMLEFWVERLDFGAQVTMRSFDLGYVDLWIPTVAIQAQLPSPPIWWGTAAVCMAAFVASYLIRPNRFLPAIYMLRAIILLQTTALLYFAFMPASFPHVLEDYVASNLFAGIMLLALIPWILGVTFYLFDFPLIKKVALTLAIFALFIVALPLQYLLHVNLIAYGSLLFMPVLYLVFGLFLDVMAFVALYAYGMTMQCYS